MNCSLKCGGKYRSKYLLREKSSRWQGGFKIENGYKLLLVKDHPAATERGYVYAHRYLMEKKLGRYLKTDEVVHHKNMNKLDNRLRNLIILSPAEHMRIHHKLKSYTK